MTPAQLTYGPPAGLSQDRHIDGLPLGTRGGMLVRHMFPLDAEYEFTVAGGIGPIGFRGSPRDVTLDGERVSTPTTRSFRMTVAAGPHTLRARSGALGKPRRGPG